MHELVESDIARAGITDIGRDGRSAVGGTKRADDPAGSGRVARLGLVCRLAGEFGRGTVQVTCDFLEPVIRARDPVGIERIGLD